MLTYAVVLYYFSLYNSSKAAPLSASSNLVGAFAAAGASLRGTTSVGTTSCPRTRLEIIWACLATILAASWVSVHPNMPNPSDSAFKKTVRRMELMFWAIASPELIIYWAMRQWYGVKKMQREFPAVLCYEDEEPVSGPLTEEDFARRNCFKWTNTHGFFLQMGGFVLYQEGIAHQVLGWHTLLEYYSQGRINLCRITEQSINDHSKADGFGKGIALVQTLWFIIQCVARFSDERLVLTELELLTAALAVLSLIMYLLWWYKPFKAETPVSITLLEPNSWHPAEAPVTQNTQDQGILKAPKKTLSLPKLVRKVFISAPYAVGKRMLDRILDLVTEHGVRVPTGPGDPLDHRNARSTMKAPTFYSLSARSPLVDLKMMCACFSAAALFGAIHCVGWSEKIRFPSYAASLLWRISSAYITGSTPVWIFLVVFDYATRVSQPGTLLHRVYYVVWRGFYVTSFLTIPFYFMARVTLLFLSFLQLRNLPQGALDNVEWAHVIPFIH
ncbi:hypothetical protein D9613_006714 [Agrocybe pediades]|uniref:Uncharacterized protein n=1 Tax=Agrocybe pediades TaxID=84607 RepID=A0A8H4QHD1_9AGAR|nr:hypothetical protein D9613_006714 [Agrocybe pediades]